jgi:hypothetical protein
MGRGPRSRRERAVAEAAALAKAGDPDAIGFLRSYFAGELGRYIDSLVDDPDAARDVFDSLFSPEVLAKYQSDAQPFTVWIRQMARKLSGEVRFGRGDPPEATPS